MTRFHLLLCAALLAACSQTTPSETPAGPEIALDANILDSLDLYAPELVRAFYQRNDYTLAWLDTGGLRPPSDSLLAFIRNAAYYGLNPRHYRTHDMQRKDIADVYLTDNFFALAVHLKLGRVHPRTLGMLDVEQHSDSTIVDVAMGVVKNNNVRETLEGFEPAHQPYHDLKAALQRELAIPSPADEAQRKRVETIHINMDRWRWEKQPLPWRYIAVNVPSFRLRVVEHDSTVMASKVIIGKRETPTPELRSVIRTFIIYPYWHVPRSIFRELLPNIQADSTYMDRRNYQVLGHDGNVIDHSTLDWASYTAETFPYILRQREGDENTMGVLKFVFANNYNVYLHDTNARGLFSREYRALSHGCVRVHRAVDLARYLAKDDDTYVDPQDLEQYLAVKAKLTVKVVKPIPVLLQYLTATVEDGNLQIHEDIYLKDQEIASALYHLELHAQGAGAAALGMAAESPEQGRRGAQARGLAANSPGP